MHAGQENQEAIQGNSGIGAVAKDLCIRGASYTSARAALQDMSKRLKQRVARHLKNAPWLGLAWQLQVDFLPTEAHRVSLFTDGGSVNLAAIEKAWQDSVDESDLDIEPFGAEDEGPVQCGDVNSTDLRVADRVPVHHAPVALRHHGGICAEAAPGQHARRNDAMCVGGFALGTAADVVGSRASAL